MRSPTRGYGTSRVASDGNAFVAALLRYRLATCAAIVLVVFGLAALLAPWIDHHDPRAQDSFNKYARPSSTHWLGTDRLGRDEYSRLVHGARVSLTIGVLSQVIGIGIGLPVGMAAGLCGRRIDALLMRVTDIAYAFPDLLLLILIVSVWGPSVWLLTIAIGLVSWATIARLVRGQVLSLREEPFVAAARAAGASDARIASRHLLSNVAGPVIVAGTFGIPQAIFAEAALSFIGLGVPLPTATWGSLVVESNSKFQLAPHLVLASCSTVAIAMASFMVIGDALRDALDPRTARRTRRVRDPVVSIPSRSEPALPKAA